MKERKVWSLWQHIITHTHNCLFNLFYCCFNLFGCGPKEVPEITGCRCVLGLPVGFGCSFQLANKLARLGPHCVAYNTLCKNDFLYNVLSYGIRVQREECLWDFVLIFFETHNVGKTFENEKWHGLFVFLGHARTVNSRRPVFVASATFINFWKLLQQANLICLVNDSNSGGSWFKSRRASPPKQLKRKRKEIM